MGSVMRNWVLAAALCLIPGGVVLAVGIAIWRRANTRNRVTVVNPPKSPVLKVMKGGRA